MKNGEFAKWKPGVNRSVHLFVAALLWTSVGTMLIVRGLRWIGPGNTRWFVFLAFGIGTAKSLLILDKSARRGVQRILEFADGTCLGAIYSWKTWLLVGLMMTAGILMRTLTEPGLLLGILYVAIGWALIFSSRQPWWQWVKWVRRGKSDA